MPSDQVLNVSDTDTRRIFVGLGWDPNDTPTLKDKVGALIGKREAHHDLDLACYYYNKDKACLGFVSADAQHGSNPSGSIYHSGDSVEGIGDGDDEQISVELAKLPPNVEYLIFKASIKSGHHFGEVAMPEIRICDGYTERVFLEKTLEDGSDHSAYVFVCVLRGETEGTWMMREISAFQDNLDTESWKDALSAYL